MVIALLLLILGALLWVISVAFNGGVRVALHTFALVAIGYALGRMASLW